jgi:hypothetical protein
MPADLCALAAAEEAATAVGENGDPTRQWPRWCAVGGGGDGNTGVGLCTTVVPPCRCRCTECGWWCWW